jgi:hypothetical protein
MGPMHTKPIMGCAVEPRERRLVLTCSLDKTARVTNVMSGNLVAECIPAGNHCFRGASLRRQSGASWCRISEASGTLLCTPSRV